jgi:hypothetical protein
VLDQTRDIVFVLDNEDARGRHIGNLPARVFACVTDVLNARYESHPVDFVPRTPLHALSVALRAALRSRDRTRSARAVG